MRKDWIVVGFLTETEHGKVLRREVTVCPGYGIICYGLGVTNGAIAVCATRIKDMFNSLERARKESGDPKLEYVLTLEDEVLDIPSMTAKALFERLLAVYEKYGD
jgi:hypothetical protein